MKDTMEVLSNPVIQYGFAGFCIILIGVIIWLIKQLLNVINTSNKVISANTAAIESLKGSNEQTNHEIECVQTAVYSLRDKVVQRPCIRVKE